MKSLIDSAQGIDLTYPVQSIHRHWLIIGGLSTAISSIDDFFTDQISNKASELWAPSSKKLISD